jgi:hypothetical protein
MSKRKSSQRRHRVTLEEFQSTDENQVFVFKKPIETASRQPSSPVVTKAGFVTRFRHWMTNFWRKSPLT